MNRVLHPLAGQPVVIGSGLAGLMTALMLAPRPVVLLTKAALGAESSSSWAQGGIAASMGADDTPDLHLEDTLLAGDGLCDPVVAKGILADAALAIAALESNGIRFDRNVDGTFSLGLEAAHSRRRIVHAGGDGAGVAIVDAMIAAVRQAPSVTVLEGFEVRRLMTHEGRICGVACATDDGESLIVPTAEVVLATGGIGGLYEATTNPAGNFGHGLALAARAGAVLADMEFVQFHPTALSSARYPLALVSEAVRGEGAWLVNSRGERFMARVAGKDLAPRDVVARAISAEIAQGNEVFLDARAAIGDRFAMRFPLIDGFCKEAGIDPALQPVPVRPAAHYHMGGVQTDCNGRSSVPGLWAAGEVASTGLHGANRLASNSLLEAAVMGIRVATDLAKNDLLPGSLPQILPALPPAADLRAVRSIVSAHLGVLRDDAGLERAIATLLPMAQSGDASADPAIVALLIATAAHRRRESRGAHARTDFPARQPVAVRHSTTLAQALDAAQAIFANPSAARSA